MKEGAGYIWRDGLGVKSFSIGENNFEYSRSKAIVYLNGNTQSNGGQ